MNITDNSPKLHTSVTWFALLATLILRISDAHARQRPGFVVYEHLPYAKSISPLHTSVCFSKIMEENADVLSFLFCLKIRVLLGYHQLPEFESYSRRIHVCVHKNLIPGHTMLRGLRAVLLRSC